MLTAYSLTRQGPEPVQELTATDIERRIRWIDLLNPTPEEDAQSEQILGVSIPTREEAQEIEFSSRFYIEDGGQFLTISVVAGVDAGKPVLTPLSFVLSRGRLATVRYEDFAAFRQFIARAAKIGETCSDATGVMLTLMDSIIDRIADVMERTGAEIDRLNRDIFRRGSKPKAAGGKKREQQLESFLGEVGYQNDVVSKTRESLASIERMLQYVSAVGLGTTIGPRRVEIGANAVPTEVEGEPPLRPVKGKKETAAQKAKGEGSQLKLMVRDVRSLTDHLSFLSNRATFLLEATLGLISVQQNEVIRVLTVAATILLPPTLIGTIYGMNFVHMPELNWAVGYPLALVLMVASALVPYLYLKRRGWF